jgi:hypothetical protein
LLKSSLRTLLSGASLHKQCRFRLHTIAQLQSIINKKHTRSETLTQQGPVGQPAASNTGQTVYFYTTTNALGQTTQLVATFTPTFPATKQPSASSSGTILNYSEWLSMIGTNTGTPSVVLNPNRAGSSLLSEVFKMSAVGILAIVCGGLLVIS